MAFHKKLLGRLPPALRPPTPKQMSDALFGGSNAKEKAKSGSAIGLASLAGIVDPREKNRAVKAASGSSADKNDFQLLARNRTRKLLGQGQDIQDEVAKKAKGRADNIKAEKAAGDKREATSLERRRRLVRGGRRGTNPTGGRGDTSKPELASNLLLGS